MDWKFDTLKNSKICATTRVLNMFGCHLHFTPDYICKVTHTLYSPFIVFYIKSDLGWENRVNFLMLDFLFNLCISKNVCAPTLFFFLRTDFFAHYSVIVCVPFLHKSFYFIKPKHRLKSYAFAEKNIACSNYIWPLPTVTSFDGTVIQELKLWVEARQPLLTKATQLV